MIKKNEEYLRQESAETSVQECERLDIFQLLKEELDIVEGFGLAGIQIGYPLRVCYLKIDSEEFKMINPEITNQYDQIVFNGEGCLSFPGKFINTNRFKYVVAKWTNEEGEEKQAIFQDLGATIVQHEIDHMNGKLMFDNQVKPFVQTEKKIGRNEPCTCGSGKKYKKCCGA